MFWLCWKVEGEIWIENEKNKPIVCSKFGDYKHAQKRRNQQNS